MRYDRRFWEENARQFRDDYAVRVEGVRPVVELIRDAVACAPEHERFLVDLGCGPGIVAEMARPVRFIGVDFSLPMLRLARAHIRELVLADLFRLPFRDACIPHAALLFVLSDYAAKLPALREVERILVPGGTLFFVDYGEGDEVWRFKRENYPRYLGRDPRIYLETLRSAAGLVEEAGLVVAQAEIIRHPVRLDPRRYLETRTGAPGGLVLAPDSFPDELVLRREFFLVKAAKKGTGTARASAASLASLLACRACGAALDEGPQAFACRGCGRSHPVEEGIVMVTPAGDARGG